MNRVIFIALILINTTITNGQSEIAYQTFTDNRDGKTYQTIELGATTWIAENMKFKTANAEEHISELTQTAYDGYYYPFDEINEVCPTGFRIPTTKEWEIYMFLILDLKDISEREIEFSRFTKKGNEALVGSISGKILQPFKNPNPLNVKDHGHTQSGKIVALGSFNIWIKHDNSSDPKYHLHLDQDGYLIHTHKHNIITKKKKLRKFSVRCVSSA